MRRMQARDDVDAVRQFDDRVETFDGTAIAVRVWAPVAEGRPGSPVAVLHHGVAYYGAAYAGLGRFLAGLGVPLCAPDARGHGRSGGARGEMVSGRTVLLDLHAVVCWVRRHYPNRPILLIGESMGGLFALNYAALYATQAHQVAGVLLVAPGLLIHPRQIADFTVVRHTPQARRAAEAHGRAMRAWRAALAGSRDAAWMQAHDNDPLVLPGVSGRYMLTIVAMSMRCSVTARRCTPPTLIIHGKRDGIVPYQGSLMLYHLIGAEDKALILFPEVWHTMFWDPDTPAVLERIEAWLAARFPIDSRSG
jgi:alpha-beta hydrolase superfamily lysophospholipase